MDIRSLSDYRAYFVVWVPGWIPDGDSWTETTVMVQYQQPTIALKALLV